MLQPRLFYRVCRASGQGLWYDTDGTFTGLIHNELSFCKHRDLKMDFDPELVGYVSVADSREGLEHWFSKEDVLKLQRYGWFIQTYWSTDYKFYERFQHYVINGETMKPQCQIILTERLWPGIGGHLSLSEVSDCSHYSYE